MSKFKRFLVNRLDERSTWRAIVALITLFGLSLEPSQSEAIITAGIAIGAALEALLPDPAGRMRKPSAPAELPTARTESDAVFPTPVANIDPGRLERHKSPSDAARDVWLGD